MAEVKCPMCSKLNPQDADVCEFCGARITPVTAPLETIKPGETPTPKNTSDLERTLPGWLRDARKAAGEEPQFTPEDSFSENDNQESFNIEIPDFLKDSLEPQATLPPAQKTPESPLDFLAGLAASSDEEEDAPDWLQSLRADMPAEDEASLTSSENSLQDLMSALEPTRAEEEKSQPEASVDSWGFQEQKFDFSGDQDDVDPFAAREEDTPDWLNALKAQAGKGSVESKSQDQPEKKDDLSASGAEFPSWLNELTVDGTSGTPSPEPASPLSEATSNASMGDTPDWLASLKDENPVAETPVPTASTDDTPDWLASFKDESPVVEAPVSTASTDDTPDWLASFKDESPVVESPVSTTSTDDTPDWLASLKDENPVAETPVPTASTDDTPDWLTSLQEESPVAETPVPTASTDDTPDWLTSLQGESPVAESPVPTASADDTPDWLASLKDESPVVEASVPAVSADDTPDWLASLKDESPIVEAPVPTASTEDDTPDWLASLTNENEIPGIPATAEPETPARESADWMLSLDQDSASEIAVPDSESSDTPDWLTSLQSEAVVPESSVTPELVEKTSSHVAETGDMPDWLSQAVGGDDVLPVEENVSPAKPSKAFQTGSLDDAGSLSDTPDWLAGLGSAAALGATAASAADQPETEDVVPDWMQSVSAAETPAETPLQAEVESEFTQGMFEQKPDSSFSFETPSDDSVSIPAQSDDIDSILSMDMPDWLAGFTPSELEPATDRQEVRDDGDGIAPASLPSWVQAMRPVEDVVSESGMGDNEQFVEKEGPLAGFRAVLPVPEGLVSSHKSKIYSIKLKADNVQQSQAALLDALLKSEQVAKSVSARKQSASSPILRWVVAAVLLLVILGASLTGSQSLVIPTDVTRDFSDFRSTISALDADDPVLVVMDYQPALAGEMEATLSPVLDDLMIQGTRLTFVSTSPTGPLMVSRIMEHMYPIHGYMPNEQYVDLGYLPGDAAGIQIFANNPEQAIGSEGFGNRFWTKPPLDGVNKLSDFSAIVVVTDNPDDGRIWIEQAVPLLKGKPILMVISAQAEPMLRPYYDSKQIMGILTGLSGGAIYEQQMGRPGLARAYWDSYGFGLMAAELLIFVGGVWSLISGIIARRKESVVEEA